MLRGPKMIVATITDHQTDEDSETACGVAEQFIGFFLKRPSLEDRAMQGITEAVNQQLYAQQQENRYEYMACGFSVLFVLRNKARWITGGGSMVYHFADGQLMGYSQCMDAPALGLKDKYAVELEDTFELQSGQNAFLLCSAELAKQVSPEMLQSALADSASAEEWLQTIVEQVGQKRQYCANAVILPPRKRLFRRAAHDEE